jgi:hypothetical protein
MKEINLVTTNPTQIDLKDFSIPSTQFIIGDPKAKNKINITEKDAERGLNYFYKSEFFLIEAIRNFIKKTNYLELSEMLNDDEITEEEFDIELEKNSSKYLIKIIENIETNDAQIIKDLVDKIGPDLRDFSVTEISEMFSLKEDNLVEKLNLLKKYQLSIR